MSLHTEITLLSEFYFTIKNQKTKKLNIELAKYGEQLENNLFISPSKFTLTLFLIFLTHSVTLWEKQ